MMKSKTNLGSAADRLDCPTSTPNLIQFGPSSPDIRPAFGGPLKSDGENLLNHLWLIGPWQDRACKLFNIRLYV